MSSNQQQFDLFSDLSSFEGTDVEYKGAKGGLPGDLWSTYSAFANTEGGTIYLGITQRAHALDVHGVENPEKLISDFWNTVNNRSKINCNLLGNQDVEQLAIAGSTRKVIAIRVPRASRQQRPVFVGSDPRAGTYRRNYEGDYRCSDSEVRRMFADQAEEPADSRIMTGFSFDDLHVESLRQYRNRFQSRASSHPWLAKDDQGLLEQLGGWRRDRASNQEGLTLAGLLMFGRTSAIQAVEAVPGFHLDYRERFSDDPRVRWSDRLTIDGTWEANLFQFYQQVMTKFAGDPGLKRPFTQDAEGVRSLVTPVHDALQEALVNALIHADYNGQGGIVIDRYTDRFEFSNPGTLLVSLEQILRGSVSECRNVYLQRMFQMLGVGDKAGSGIDKIRTSWKAQHWQSPRLEETQRPDRVILSLPMVSMLPASVLGELQERFGDRLRTLDKDAVQALVTAIMEGSVSNQRLQEILTLHRRDITTLLQTLVRGGYLVADGFGRGTSYTVTEGDDTGQPGSAPDSPILATDLEKLTPDSGAMTPDSGAVTPDSGAMTPDSGAMTPDSGAMTPDSGAMTPDSGAVTPDSGAVTPDSDTLLAELQGLAQPVRDTGAAPRALVQATILALCSGRYLSLHQLAALLGRNPESLRNAYVTAMLKDGLLELRYPDQPRHRQQAYRSATTVGADA